MSIPANALLIATSSSRLSTIERALAGVGWTVQAAQNPQEALACLRNGRFQAVFCDENLRGASASGFLAWSRRLSPDLPFYLFATGSVPTGSHALVPSELLHFPPLPGELPRPSRESRTPETRAEAARTPLSGNTSLVSLADLLEMMGLAGQSATVELGGGDAGSIYLAEGLLVHAVSRLGRAPSKGLQALAELVLAEGCDFRLLPYTAPARPTINMSAAAAMTEATRLADEGRRFRRLTAALQRACPEALDVAVGYPLAGAPVEGVGDAEGLFEIACGLLERSRALLGASVSEISVCADGHCTALILFSKGNLFAARGPAVRAAALQAALRGALGA